MCIKCLGAAIASFVFPAKEPQPILLSADLNGSGGAMFEGAVAEEMHEKYPTVMSLIAVDKVGFKGAMYNNAIMQMPDTDFEEVVAALWGDEDYSDKFKEKQESTWRQARREMEELIASTETRRELEKALSK